MPVFKPSKCFTRNFLDELYPILTIGDLLEFQRTGYAHWAVYVGIRQYEGDYQHCVIHRAVPPDATKKTLFLASQSAQKLKKAANMSRSETSQIGDIHLHPIAIVVGNDRVRINNERDKKWRPKDSQEIALRADVALHACDKLPYHLLSNNCEHFATSCRYGRKESKQVPDVLLKIASSVASVVVPMAARSTAVAVILPAVGIAATGPVGLAITGASVGIAVVGMAVPPVIHAIQCKNKK